MLLIPQVRMLLETNRQYHEQKTQEIMECNDYSVENFSIQGYSQPPTRPLRACTLQAAQELKEGWGGESRDEQEGGQDRIETRHACA
jgi:hypothetical protein